MCLPGVFFVSQDMPAPLPHPSDPTDPTDPTESPETIDAFKSLICLTIYPHLRHTDFLPFCSSKSQNCMLCILWVML
jgi:hypothetical protein